MSDTFIPTPMIPYTFDEWLQYGYEHGFCGPPVCAPHDGVPTSAIEDEEIASGDDPCLHIVRLYPDLATAKAVSANDQVTQYRVAELGWDR